MTFDQSCNGGYYDYFKDLKIIEQATRIAELEKEVERLKEEGKVYDPLPIWEGRIQASEITYIDEAEDDYYVKIGLGECEPELVNKEWFKTNDVGVTDYLIGTGKNIYFMEKEEFESLFTKVEE